MLAHTHSNKFVWAKDLIAALESKLGPPDSNGCRGRLNRKHNGYCQFRWKGKTYWVHRLILCIATNVPYDHTADAAHNCPGGDNKWCCTRKHLSWMDDKQHAADKIAKGQLATGDKNGS